MKYLARFWVDLEVEAPDEPQAVVLAKKIQRWVGLDGDRMPLDLYKCADEYDTQFERLLKRIES